MNIKELMASHQVGTKEVIFGARSEDGETIEDEHLKIVFVEAPVAASRSHAVALLNLLDGSMKLTPVTVQKNGKDEKDMDFNFDITKVISNFGSKTMKDIERFINAHCQMAIKVDGEWVRVDTAIQKEVDFAFGYGENSGYYYPFIFEGIKYHFAKHLPSGGGLLKRLADKMINKMQLDQLTNSKLTG